MPSARFFLPQPFKLNENVVLEGQENTHLIRVTRKKRGDRVELVNGLGELAEAEVLATEKSATTLQIKKIKETEEEKVLFIIAQALPHLQKLDFIIEKGTELGCDAFWFFEGDLSEKKGLTAGQQLRLKTIGESALKQCGRLNIPKIEFFPSIESILERRATFFFGDLERDAPWFSKVFDPEVLPLCFFVGPESGFSNREVKLLKTKALGVKLHKNILRTETASLSALTLMHHLLNASSN